MNVASLELCKGLYEEEWRSVPGLDSKFEVSNLGRIRSKYQRGLTKGKVRKVYTNSGGYQTISYGLDYVQFNLFIHIAVAKAFVRGRDGAYHVNHIDSNPSHNCAHNLEWCTPGENIEHSRTYGRADRYQNRGEKHGMAKLTNIQAINIKHCKGAISGIKLAKLYGVDDQTIYDIWNGRRWQHV